MRISDWSSDVCSSDLAFGAAAGAVVRVRADVHLAALVIEDDLVEEGLFRAAERAVLLPLLHGKGMVVEVEALHLGIGRQRVDALLEPGAEELQGRKVVHLRIVELRNRRDRKSTRLNSSH